MARLALGHRCALAASVSAPVRGQVLQCMLSLPPPMGVSAGQVAGRVVEHGSRFTFATVRNAGHMCPFTQGERTYVLFKSFIRGERLH